MPHPKITRNAEVVEAFDAVGTRSLERNQMSTLEVPSGSARLMYRRDRETRLSAAQTGSARLRSASLLPFPTHSARLEKNRVGHVVGQGKGKEYHA